jgi:hypothetical protein
MQKLGGGEVQGSTCFCGHRTSLRIVSLSMRSSTLPPAAGTGASRARTPQSPLNSCLPKTETVTGDLLKVQKEIILLRSANL